MNIFTVKAGIYDKVIHIPYGGSGPTKAAALGGHIDALPLGVSEYLAAEGQFRPLVIFTEDRNVALPDVPTGHEKGIDVEISTMRVIAVPNLIF